MYYYFPDTYTINNDNERKLHTSIIGILKLFDATANL